VTMLHCRAGGRSRSPARHCVQVPHRRGPALRPALRRCSRGFRRGPGKARGVRVARAAENVAARRVAATVAAISPFAFAPPRTARRPPCADGRRIQPARSRANACSASPSLAKIILRKISSLRSEDNELSRFFLGLPKSVAFGRCTGTDGRHLLPPGLSPWSFPERGR
jgi:hypothetical protein